MDKIDYANKTYASRLTEIAFSGKRYWNYPNEYYEIWKDELTITEEYINNNIVKIIGNDSIIKGFYAINYIEFEKYVDEVYMEKGYWLDYIFIEEEFIGKGLGKIMFIDIINEIKKIGASVFYVLAEPFAEEFYVKMGCIYCRKNKSRIENRNLSVYKYEI
jgi:GNAT superfamily N-acetyltransferase